MIATRLLYLLCFLAILPFGLSDLLPLLKPLGYVYDAILLAVLFVDFRITPPAKLISGSREITERLSIGRANLCQLKIVNRSLLALDCVIKDDFPSSIPADIPFFAMKIPAAGAVTFSYNLIPNRRGAYKFGNINLRYKSRLGLFCRQIALKCSGEVKVFSDLKSLYELSVKLSHTSELGELNQRKRGQGTEFSSLKEYTSGDDAKSIDWKATARRQKPVIRTYEVEKEQRLIILIDAGRMMVSDLSGLTRFDHALNAALCLALTGLSHSDQVGFGVFADRPLLYLPPRRGKNYLKKILEASFDVEPKLVEPDYQGVLSYFASVQKGRCLMVVLTDLTDPTGSQALLSGLSSLSSRHLPFCVTLKDQQVIDIASRSLKEVHGLDLSGSPQERKSAEVESIFKRAVAQDLLSQRELALNVLQRRGCLVLDCPPHELSDKLVDSYLDIKMKNRL